MGRKFGRKLRRDWTRALFFGSVCVTCMLSDSLFTMTRTLLIIDDNESVRESLRFLLERRGYATALAASGPDALALLEQQVFDGAMIDMNMPVMNGLEVCRELHARAAASGRKLAIWMMTGARTAELAKAAEEAGALGIFSKPFDFDELYRNFEAQFGVPPPASAS